VEEPMRRKISRASSGNASSPSECRPPLLKTAQQFCLGSRAVGVTLLGKRREKICAKTCATLRPSLTARGVHGCPTPLSKPEEK
jgi:hypothetical protein